MPLVYRGHTYNATPAIETPTTEVIGHYRGHTVVIKSSLGIQSSEPVSLSYRGIRYTHTR